MKETKLWLNKKFKNGQGQPKAYDRATLMNTHNTNLTSNDLIIKIMCEICSYWFISFMHGYHALKTHLTHKYIGWYRVHSFINSHFICHHIHPCLRCVFNAWSFMHKTYEPMNKKTLHDFYY
jgi:hypothetical protein